jgi:cobalamin biosynthesis Co2+ chelatase CbiK
MLENQQTLKILLHLSGKTIWINMNSNKTELIQALIDQNGYKSYLEIGLGDQANFNALQVEYKEGVDPLYNLTSDAFFEANKAYLRPYFY